MCRANCWDCNDFYIGKTKRRLRDRKSEHFKALTTNGGFDNNEIRLYPFRYITATLTPLSWSVVINILNQNQPLSPDLTVESRSIYI